MFVDNCRLKDLNEGPSLAVDSNIDVISVFDVVADLGGQSNF
jgi:hypothetical protein